jgi:hypothetical protein
VTQSGPVMELDRDRSVIGVEDDDADATAAMPITVTATSACPTDVRRVELAERERDAREALRGQIARLERESAAIVADGFPHISPAGRSYPVGARGDHRRHEARPGRDATHAGPRLLTLAELERVRDRLVGHTQDLRRLAAERVEHERRARELLEAMRLEPGRYRFERLPVRDLGEGGCGVWEVRPRLGLIGMLAGWWQVKLSSGCP